MIRKQLKRKINFLWNVIRNLNIPKYRKFEIFC